MAEVKAEADTEIIGMIIKPVIGMLESLVGAKPILMVKGKGATKDDIAAKHPSSAAKVSIKSKRINGKKPKVYQYAQLDT